MAEYVKLRGSNYRVCRHYVSAYHASRAYSLHEPGNQVSEHRPHTSRYVETIAERIYSKCFHLSGGMRRVTSSPLVLICNLQLH
ncbi:hypothetical protein CERSUDRAFT_114616 [Gelatoporia subvermispora B]|uniref:Uncharacterized protein n=1 Tax=Ceriporiopsis subvermispora (strain B) TaxID=914234 RepID=M2QHZ2_CERS8|nr:hypothetical protein CERSUDRAFT_114616 [Gelatoporia subvermispora B]